MMTMKKMMAAPWVATATNFFVDQEIEKTTSTFYFIFFLIKDAILFGQLNENSNL